MVGYQDKTRIRGQAPHQPTERPNFHCWASIHYVGGDHENSRKMERWFLF